MSAQAHRLIHLCGHFSWEQQLLFAVISTEVRSVYIKLSQFHESIKGCPSYLVVLHSTQIYKLQANVVRCSYLCSYLWLRAQERSWIHSGCGVIPVTSCSNRWNNELCVMLNTGLHSIRVDLLSTEEWLRRRLINSLLCSEATRAWCICARPMVRDILSSAGFYGKQSMETGTITGPLWRYLPWACYTPTVDHHLLP